MEVWWELFESFILAMRQSGPGENLSILSSCPTSRMAKIRVHVDLRQRQSMARCIAYNLSMSWTTLALPPFRQPQA